MIIVKWLTLFIWEDFFVFFCFFVLFHSFYVPKVTITSPHCPVSIITMPWSDACWEKPQYIFLVNTCQTRHCNVAALFWIASNLTNVIAASTVSQFNFLDRDCSQLNGNYLTCYHWHLLAGVLSIKQHS